MKNLSSCLLLALCAALPLSAAIAQTAAPTTAASSDALYKALGEKPGIDKLADDFVNRLLTNDRMRPFFEKANLPSLKGKLADQFCVVSGGPCSYKGADMKSAHSNFDINKGDFNALVEVLQQSMAAQGIAFTDQNKLLAQLAPMHRDVITVR